MRPAGKAELPGRERGRPTRVIRGRVLAAGGGEDSGGAAADSPLPGPELARCARRGRGTGPYDPIDLEFYLDCIGGE